MTASFYCDVADRTFDGIDGRPDCVRASDCSIYEFKPNNSEAIELGWKQLDGYEPYVTKYYQTHLDNRTDPDAAHGGAAIMKAFEERGCIRDKKIELRTDVETYDMCQSTYRCVEN